MSKLSVNELTDETGSGAPSFPNGVSVTGAALTDPEITGGIYLGGTGSANYLDDYEEGTWTPQFVDNSGNNINTIILDGSATYTKIGSMVYLFANIRTDELSNAGRIGFSGLPFAHSRNRVFAPAAKIRFVNFSEYCFWTSNSQRFHLNSNPSGSSDLTVSYSDITSTSSEFGINIAYETDS